MSHFEKEKVLSAIYASKDIALSVIAVLVIMAVGAFFINEVVELFY